MRARHRHFNARDCNAALCLDARFINGLSDSDDVQTWTDRSRNSADAAQSNAASRPIYKTAIQGGQPAVRFDGSNAFYPMTTPMAGVFRNKNYGLTLAAVQDRTPTAGREVHIVFGASTATNFLARTFLRTRRVGGNTFEAFGRRLDGDSAVSVETSSDNNWSLLAAETQYADNVLRLRRNFSSIGTTTYSSGGGNTSDTDSANVEIGSFNNNINRNAAPIDLAQLIVLNTATSAALVKRLHHAAAYSFKISCN